jgi:Arc/MetJ family transcription regulator
LGDEEKSVRIRVELDDELVEKAMSYTGLRQKSALIREALVALVEREAARRLAGLGGSEPDLLAVPRRRSTAK